MRSTLRRVMTTLVVDLIVVAGAAGPGWTLILTPSRPGRAPREVDPRLDRTPHR